MSHSSQVCYDRTFQTVVCHQFWRSAADNKPHTKTLCRNRLVDFVTHHSIDRLFSHYLNVVISQYINCCDFAAGTDYVPYSSQLTFPPSLDDMLRLCFNISIINNDNIDAAVRQFEVSLNSTQDGVLFDINLTATINILDDDGKNSVIIDVWVTLLCGKGVIHVQG